MSWLILLISLDVEPYEPLWYDSAYRLLAPRVTPVISILPPLLAESPLTDFLSYTLWVVANNVKEWS